MQIHTLDTHTHRLEHTELYRETCVCAFSWHCERDQVNLMKCEKKGKLHETKRRCEQDRKRERGRVLYIRNKVQRVEQVQTQSEFKSRLGLVLELVLVLKSKAWQAWQSVLLLSRLKWCCCCFLGQVPLPRPLLLPQLLTSLSMYIAGQVFQVNRSWLGLCRHRLVMTWIITWVLLKAS